MNIHIYIHIYMCNILNTEYSLVFYVEELKKVQVTNQMRKVETDKFQLRQIITNENGNADNSCAMLSDIYICL